MESHKLREMFPSFFEGKGHRRVPSAPLVPHGDPTLLFTSAGMVQFKPYFMGQSAAPHPRLTSCQKCFRTSDIESVGDTSHLTFFEMLGNFSVGDYFKKEAVQWAWEFVTSPSCLGLPPERLWATVYLNDDETMGLWRQVGVPEGRIRRFGKGDNWWGPAGNEGPCGPCSELHYDFGPGHGCGREDCAPNCECGRFLEIWNLVFMQFNQDLKGNLTPLPRPNIDTGMGLERVAAVMQGKTEVYQTDFFTPLIEGVGRLCGKSYGESPEVDRALRVVAEHARAVAFLIADGVVPGNDGRGYVLRRLLRRAALFGRRLGLEGHFLGQVAEAVIEHMGDVYPELVRHRDLVLAVVEEEETRFERTLPVGMGVYNVTFAALREELLKYWPRFETSFQQALSESVINHLQHGVLQATEDFERDYESSGRVLIIGGINVVDETLRPIEAAIDELRRTTSGGWNPQDYPKDSFEAFKGRIARGFEALKATTNFVNRTITGLEAFILYDTYGFPVELTQELARERGFEVDLPGFEAEMERQRERSRAKKFVIEEGLLTEGGFVRRGFRTEIPETEFVGYERTRCTVKIVGLMVDGKPTEKAFRQGEKVTVFLDQTPFYAEAGGQVGDTGFIQGLRGKVEVTDTSHYMPDLASHISKLVEGELALGDVVEAAVDEGRRLDIARNHTATHLLHTALRRVVGEHVYQRGSMVAPERLRFDYSHYVALSSQELTDVQAMVNDGIRRDLPVSVKEVFYQEAMDQGVIALFGEKYGEVVRMVQAGDFSRELCGGTHLRATGEIGFFVILSEASIGSGMRRIEAVTGRGAEAFVRERLSALDAIGHIVKSADPTGAVAKVEEMVAESERERRHSHALEMRLMRDESGQLISQVEEVDGVKVVAARVQVSGRDALREMGDMVRDGLGSGVVVLGALVDRRPAFLAMVTKDLIPRGLHAGEMVKAVAGVTGGGGGGRPEMAQAGGKDGSKLDQALGMVKEMVGRLREQERP